jgi:transcriptional regulator with XRE-family HTH domain
MTRAVDPDQAQRFQEALGDQLRQARSNLRLTRQDVLQRLGLGLSAQTLASYELGNRRISVIRLIELADVLGVSALELLARGLRRVSRVEPPVSVLRVDLAAVVRDRTPELAPLRRWALSRLQSLPDRADTVVRLEPGAVRYLAEICAVDPGDLACLLDVYALLGNEPSNRTHFGLS